jgi:hypothetical protein
VSSENREVLGDWLLVAGALALFGSLFLTWSHQIPRDALVPGNLGAAIRGGTRPRLFAPGPALVSSDRCP